MAGATYLCGGDLSAGPRDECPSTLHDWPLPSGYVDAAEVAGSRIRRRWSQPVCPDCRLHGWVPGRLIEGEIPTGARTHTQQERGTDE